MQNILTLITLDAFKKTPTEFRVKIRIIKIILKRFGMSAIDFGDIDLASHYSCILYNISHEKNH